MMHFWLNGHAHSVPPEPMLLLDYLRERQLTGNKGACREGDCGSCQVLICDDPGHAPLIFRAQTACLIRVQDLAQQHVLTVEGVRQEGHSPNPLLRLLADAGASQCGFCSPGLLMACIHWLLNGPELTPAEGEAWLNGNLCRCTGYMGQRRGVQEMAAVWGETLRSSHDRVQTLIDQHILPAFLLRPLSDRVAMAEKTQPESQGCQDQRSGQAASERQSCPSHIIVGGGTDLYLQHPLTTLHVNPQLARYHDPVVREEEGGLYLNARQSLQRIADTLQQQRLLPSFARFNHLFASLPVRNRATLGGNLAHASPVADSIPYLLVQEARLHTSLRVIALADFFTGFKQTCLQAGEVIEWIQLPRDAADTLIHFDKVSRRGTTDIAIVNGAGYWRVNNNVLDEVRLAVGGASPMPVRLPALENALRGQTMADLPLHLPSLLERHLQGSLSPITDLRGSAHYRRLLAQQLMLAQLDQWLQTHKQGVPA